MTKEYDNKSPLEVVRELDKITESTKKTIDETQYPLTLKEFTKKYKDKIITNCKKQYQLTTEEVTKDLEEYLQENPTTIQDDYVDCCEYYDLCKKYYGKEKRAEGEAIVSPQIAFNARLNLNVHQVGTELYFW